MRKNNFKIKNPNSNKYSKGATLLEVLVSVFLLTFGVLGLMAAQLRSVAVVSETESQTYAAQAAEALSEAMQINPNIGTDKKRNYDGLYIMSKFKEEKDFNKTGISTTVGTELTKGELKDEHIKDFEYVLSKMPNAFNIKYIICNDKLEPEAPTLSKENCNKPSNASDDYSVMIKIIWQSQDANSQSGANETVSSSEHSYMLRVPK